MFKNKPISQEMKNPITTRWSAISLEVKSPKWWHLSWWFWGFSSLWNVKMFRELNTPLLEILQKHFDVLVVQFLLPIFCGTLLHGWVNYSMFKVYLRGNCLWLNQLVIVHSSIYTRPFHMSRIDTKMIILPNCSRHALI